MELMGAGSAHNQWKLIHTTNILHFPPRGILKIGGGNFNTFSKVDQAVPNWASSAKKKNVPNWAKIIGECFAEFLFCGPGRPSRLYPGLTQKRIGDHELFLNTPWCWPNVLLSQARIRPVKGPPGLEGP